MARATEFPDHGVKTLSIILADDERLRGVAPGAHVIPHRVANGPVFRGHASTKTIGSAIEHGLGRPHPPRVVSISMGNPGVLGLWELARIALGGEPLFAGAARRAIDRAYEAGVIVVCAAGQIIEGVVYPARFARTIAVGGFRRDGAMLTHYPRGGYPDMERVDVWAVAEDVNRAAAHLDDAGKMVFTWADDPDAPGGEPSGTSYACPQAAAAAALWVETHHDALEAAFARDRWKIVEAFRKALKVSAEPVSARNANRAGGAETIWTLDVEALLATPPDPDAAYRKRGAASEAGVL
jgi:subtilisin family serine protease